MIARYGNAENYITIEDDGRITANGASDFGSSHLDFFPRTSPGPDLGAVAYEIWGYDKKKTLKASDKPIQIVNTDEDRQYLFVFRASCSIDFYYLGQNFHTGTDTYLFMFRVPNQPSEDAEKWRIYDWIKALA